MKNSNNIEAAHRYSYGGLIERDKPLRFSFDGDVYRGYQGDTLASALLANGVKHIGRSFKYHRLRGLFGAGAEEPNGLIQLEELSRTEPNVRATQIELYEGLVAHSQNRFPTLRFDLGAINNLVSPILPAGFYYKTFKWPASMWMTYEKVIRRMAGLGKAPIHPDPDKYFKRYVHCDILVVGAGCAGISAALTAARNGAKVILMEERPYAGGQLNFGAFDFASESSQQWVSRQMQQLTALDNVTVLMRTVAAGYFDHNMVVGFEHVGYDPYNKKHSDPRFRLWHVRAKQIILATGALERPIAFPGNDCPGVMLASAVQRYAKEFAVKCGDQPILFTNNDGAYELLSVLSEMGTKVSHVIDSRSSGPGGDATTLLQKTHTRLLKGHVVCNTQGRNALNSINVCEYENGNLTGHTKTIGCDLLCVSGGWNPTVHLFSQSQGKIEFDAQRLAFLPGKPAQAMHCTGSLIGFAKTSRCIASAISATQKALLDCGLDNKQKALSVPHCEGFSDMHGIEAMWEVSSTRSKKKCFIDFQNDVTANDVRLAIRENYSHVEHLKRYTTLGMGTDQGRTSNINGLAILAQQLHKDIPAVGTTTFRAPYQPIPMGGIAGIETGDQLAPYRRSPLHDWHMENGAHMINAGIWLRPQFYIRQGETDREAWEREAVNVRTHVGISDVSTLGKIDVQGKDAAEFLERLCLNKITNLKLNRCRYHLMLREDGMLFDDGTTTRIGDQQFYVTTTTGHAALVMSHMEFYAQTVWPELDVHLCSITDQWGGMAIAGPNARQVLSKIVDNIDVGNEALPFMAHTEAKIRGVSVHLFRITFSGELGYEIHMPAKFAQAIWDLTLTVGEAHGIQSYGLEALGILRQEKGHVVHAELDGRTIPGDFGFDKMIRKESDFVGRRSLERDGFATEKRHRYVGLLSQNNEPIARGAHLVVNKDQTNTASIGHVSSRCYSPNIQKHIGLGFVANADDYMGKALWAISPLENVYTKVQVTSPVFFDSDGSRQRV